MVNKYLKKKVVMILITILFIVVCTIVIGYAINKNKDVNTVLSICNDITTKVDIKYTQYC